MVDTSKNSDLGRPSPQELSLLILTEPAIRGIHGLPAPDVLRLSPLEARKLVEKCIESKLREE